MTAAVVLPSIKTRVHELLMQRGTWMTRPQLEMAIKAAGPVPKYAVEDALVDLVIEMAVVYRDDVGYRLSGHPLAREAAKQLSSTGAARSVCSRVVNHETILGIAEKRHGLGLVMYALALPAPKTPEQIQAHLEMTIDFLTRKETTA